MQPTNDDSIRIANPEQAAAWDGEEGEGWARDHEHYDRSVGAYRQPMLDAAAITDGERVLDVGCGNGQSTRDAARSTPIGHAVGVDLSSPMLARARALAAAEGLTNVEFVRGDAQVHPFPAAAFDVAISRFGSMFFADKVAAFTNIAGAVRPGGRVLLVVWKDLAENEQFRTMFETALAGREMPTPPPGAPSPFAFADPRIGRSWLEDAGLVDVRFEAVRRPFWLGADVDDAFAFASQVPAVRGLLRDLDADGRAAARSALRDALLRHATEDGVLFDSATWFVTATKP